MNRFFVFLSAILFCAGFSCNPSVSRSSGGNSSGDTSSVVDNKVVSLIRPNTDKTYKSGDQLVFKAEVYDYNKKIDSLNFLIDGKVIGKLLNISDSIIYNTTNIKLGNRNVEVVVYFNNEKPSYDLHKILVKFGIAPKLYTYKVLKVYPHDKNAYTQGLVYENGILYEGTGLKGQSTLRKINLETGISSKTVSLPSEYFGEGISVFDNKIVQITWQEQVAFLYDKESFQLINKFFYPMEEGWGLTYNGKELIMSDGTSNLYYIDKDYFTETSRIEVYDNNGPIDQLNELEFINDEIWSNVYLTDTILRINPHTGAVIAKIDMSGLLKPEDKEQNTNVLNGIAYDFKGKRLFVTGKNWPKLFEVGIIPKK
jgi:glutamine cyclotransferase